MLWAIGARSKLEGFDVREWEAACLRWRGATLKGEFSHWCDDWDGLPVDETCEEFAACHCRRSDWDVTSLIAAREKMADLVEEELALSRTRDSEDGIRPLE